MDVAALIPSPDSIPVPWPWFQVFLIVTFTIHLVFMNAMLGSMIIALAGLLRPTAGRLAEARTGSRIVPGLIAFTVNTGVAPLLFVHVLYGQFIFTSSVLMAWWWLTLVGLLLAAYAGAYLVDFRFDALDRCRTWILAGSTGLLLAVAFIFTNNTTLMLAPWRWMPFLTDPGGTLLNLAEPMLLPRYLHFVTASLAVGGLTQAWMARRQAMPGDPDAAERFRRAMGWFNGATGFQFVVGGTFFFCLPTAVRFRFMGGDVLATSLMALSLALAAGSLFMGMRHRLAGCTILGILTVLFMVLVRDQVRQAMLAPYYSPADLPVNPDAAPLVIFLVALVLAMAAVGIMLRLAFRRPAGAPP